MARKLIILKFLCFLLFLGPSSPQQPNTLVQQQELKDGDELVSPQGHFRLGSFNLTANNSYLGIWYSGDRLTNVVWVANPNAPIFGNSGSLTVDDYGSLKISYSTASHSLSLYSAQQGASINTTAVRLNTGNFVLRELNSDGTVKRELWQSFDYSTDTLLPGMKLGVNKKSGHIWSLRSWRSDVVPDVGAFTFGMNMDSSKPGNEFDILWRRDIYWTGVFSNYDGYQDWPKNGFSLPDQKGSYYSFSEISNEDETYFNYLTPANKDITTFPRLRIDYLGKLYLGEKLLVQCNPSSPDSNEGCVKQKLSDCRSLDFTISECSVYIVDSHEFEFRFNDSDNLTQVDCQNKCLNNCSCLAYASSKWDRTGCKIWTKVASFEWSLDAPKVYFFEYKGKTTSC